MFKVFFTYGVPNPELFYDISTQNSVPIPVPYFKVGDKVRLLSDNLIWEVVDIVIKYEDAVKAVYIASPICTQPIMEYEDDIVN